nr:hypothetical protein [Tanacetum cinerariifolium]
GGIDWDLNVRPEDIDEPSKTGQPIDAKDKAEMEDAANTKENKAPPQGATTAQSEATGKGVSDQVADPEADIDSDEEAALR